jgi:hypothetical protein
LIAPHPAISAQPSTISGSPANPLGQSTQRHEKFYTEIVENPVEKKCFNAVRAPQIEQISGLHHPGAVAHAGPPKPTDYTVITS